MMKKLSVAIFSLLFFVSAFLGLDRFVHRKSDRLAPYKVTAFQPFCPLWNTDDLNPEDLKEIDQILSQKFTYFSKGTQAHVYLSEDKKYVLKFIKQHSYRPTSWLCYLPFSFNPYYHNYRLRQKQRHDTYQACKTAFTEFKQETALIYLHLNPTCHLNRKVTLFDKKGRKCQIDIDKTCFLIQKKANLIYSRITELMANKEVDKAKQIIGSVFALIDLLGKRGVVDNDPVIRRNFGLIDDQAVQIDIGKMRIDPTRVLNYRQDIDHITRPFRKWIEKNFTELLPCFDDNLQKAISLCCDPSKSLNLPTSDSR